MQQAFVKLRRGETGQLPPPVENMHQLWSASEQYGVQQALSMSLVGDKTKVRHGLESILRETEADEIMVNGQIRPPCASAFFRFSDAGERGAVGVVSYAAFLPHFFSSAKPFCDRLHSYFHIIPALLR